MLERRRIGHAPSAPRNGIHAPARTMALALLAALALPMLGGCENIQRSFLTVIDVTAAGLNGLQERAVKDDPLWVAIEEPVFLDVESFNGPVIVDVDPEADLGKVVFTRVASHGSKRKKEAEASLDQIGATVEMVTGDLGQPVLQVRVFTSHGEPHFQRVKTRIELPSIDGLRIRTSNGDVIAREIQGPLDIQTNDGNIRVLTHYPMTDDVTLVNNSGSVDYRVRGESTARFDAESRRGRVIHFVKYGQMTIDAGTDHNTLKATLNRGENLVVLRAADGDVRIGVVEDPLEVGSNIW